MRLESTENAGITYYMDDIARAFPERYPTQDISGPHQLTGDFGNEECPLYPFLLVPLNTGKYWGFDFEGYKKLVDHFSNSGASTEMDFASAVVKDEGKLVDLAQKGHLRQEDFEGTAVFFPSETLIRTSTNSRL